MAISDKLNYLIETKQLFKDRLNSLGAEIIESTTFRNYLNWLDNFYIGSANKTDIAINGIDGRTSQSGTPTPDSPQPINNLSGDVEYKVSGKNKLPFPYTETSHTKNGITYTINDDGTVLVNGTATAQSDTKLYGNYQETDNKEPIGKYLYGGTNEVRIRALNHTGNSYTVLATDTGNGTEIDTSVYKKYYIEISVLQGVTVNNVLIKPMVLDSLDDLKYEPYISESFSLSLKSRNLFDKDNINVINAYISGSKIISKASPDVDKLIYIPCKPNTTYSLQKMVQETTNYNRFRIGTTTDTPALNMTVEDYFNAGDGSTLTNKTITTGANANYLIFYCYREDTLTSFEDMLSSIQIEKANNLFDKDNANVLDGAFINATVKQIGSNANAKCLFIEVEPNTPYIISKSKGNRFAIGTSSVLPKNGVQLSNILDDRTKTSFEITSSSDTKYLTIYFTISPDNDSLEDILSSIEVYKNVGSSPYEPYYDINLCNISDYKDRIYSQNGEFYLEKKTGKVVFDGSRNWTKSGNTNIDRFVLSGYVDYGDTNCFSNYFANETYSDSNYNKSKIFLNTYSNTKRFIINFNTVGTTSLSNFKTWLSTHNTIVYYVLATPTTTEITQENYPTLYSQLLAIQEFLTKYKINKEFLLDYSSPEIEY